MRGRWRTAFCAVTAAGLVLALQPGAVCSAQEQETQNVRRVAVFTYSYASEYWGYVTQGCMAWSRDDPTLEVDVKSVSSSIAGDEQMAMIRQDLESGRYDGYVIAAIDTESMDEALREVELPVVSIDSPLDADCVISFIGTDNELASAAGARQAVSMAKDNGFSDPECVMIGGLEGGYNQERRVAGYKRGVEEAGGIWLDKVYQTDKSVADGGKAMEEIMKDYPDGIAIIACYNDTLAESALEECEGNPAFADTVFLGFDGNGSVCERIMNDDRYANMVTVAQNPYEMGFHAMEIMSDYFKSQGQGDSGDLSQDDESGADADESSQGKEPGADTDTSAMDDKFGSDSQDASPQETGKGGSGKDQAKTEGIPFIDSGYAVITSVNAQERMTQIMNHIS